jgi:protoporphyrinogen oxidase
MINRVAEFKNFVADTAPADQTVLCCEVTDLRDFSVGRVVAELERAGVLHAREVLDSKVIELAHAYPVYDRGYEAQMLRARDFFSAHRRVHHVGRHAQFAHKDVDEIFDEAKRLAQRIVSDHDSPADNLAPDS